MKTATWAKLMVASFGAAAIIAAAQLGVGQALSIIDVSAGLEPGADGARNRLVTWLVFVFGTAILGGVALGRRIVRRRIAFETRPSPQPTTMSSRRGRAIETLRAAKAPVALAAVRITASLAAAVGAACVYPLIWVPARDALAAGGSEAQLTLAMSTGAGIVVGLVLAIAALAAAPIGVALVVTVTWVWLIALVSVILALSKDQLVSSPRLGTLDAPWLITSNQWWLGPYLMVGLCALIGLAVAGAARWIGASRTGIALSGFAGPALLAAAYVAAGPGIDSTDSGQIKPYLASIIAATVGLLASTAVGSGAQNPVRTVPVPAPPRAVGAQSQQLAVGQGTPQQQLAAARAQQRPSAPLAISSGPSGVYQAPSRGAPVVEGRVLRAEPPRRIEAGTFIDLGVAESQARASSRLQAEEREQVTRMTQERTARAEAAAAKKRADAQKRAEAKAKVEETQRAAAAAKAAAAAEAKARAAEERARQQALQQAQREAQRQQAEAQQRQAEAERRRVEEEARAFADAERRRAEDEAQAVAEAARQRAAAQRAEEEARAKAEADAAARAAKSKSKSKAKAKPKPEPVRVPTQPDRDRSGPDRGSDRDRGRGNREKALRKGEAEHIDWVTNLVNLPHDPDLKTRRG